MKIKVILRFFSGRPEPLLLVEYEILHNSFPTFRGRHYWQLMIGTENSLKMQTVILDEFLKSKLFRLS